MTNLVTNGSDLVYIDFAITSQKLISSLVIPSLIDISSYDYLVVAITNHNRNNNNRTANLYFQSSNTYSHIHTTFSQALPGPTGPTGPTGANSTVTGPTGYTGYTGPTGANSMVTGPTGPPSVNTLQQVLNAGNSATGTNAKIFLNTNTTGGANNPIIILKNTDTVNGSVTLNIEKDKGVSSSVGEILSQINTYGKSTSNIVRQFSSIQTTCRVVTNGAEEGVLSFNIIDAGAQATYLDLNGQENQVNLFKPLDMNGNAITTSTGDLVLNGPTTGANVVINTSSVGDILLNSSDRVQLTAVNDIDYVVGGIQTFKMRSTKNSLFKPLDVQNQQINTSIGNIVIENPVLKSAGNGDIDIKTTGGGDVFVRTTGGLGGGDLYLQSQDFLNVESAGAVHIEAGQGAVSGNLSLYGEFNTYIEGKTGITLSTTAGTGDISLSSGKDVVVAPLSLTGDLVLNGANIQKTTAGAAGANFLRIKLNGVYYKIQLLADV